MDPSDADDGVAATDVPCGRPTTSLADTSTRARSYRREEEVSACAPGFGAQRRQEKVSCILGADTLPISTAADTVQGGLLPTDTQLGGERGI